MTLQVTVFSVLLFGTSGVVLDFGRVYSEHTVMQSYTDQAALAAASELNGLPDAIERATDSVFGAGLISKGGVFSDPEDGALKISHVMFMKEMSPDLGSQFDMGSDATGDNLIYVAFGDGGAAFGAGYRDQIDAGLPEADALAQASLEVRNVIVVAEERSVRNSLMKLINVSNDGAVANSQSVRTIAAASYKRVVCGEFDNLSSFVICDPWSGFTDTDFSDQMTSAGATGRQFRFEADVNSTAMNRLMRLKTPKATAVVQHLCSSPATLPGYFDGMSDAEFNLAQTICMLSTNSTNNASKCFKDQEKAEVELVNVSGEVATTALNTAFNMWDEPIAEVVTWADSGGVEALSSELFQPDMNILKGVIWNQRLADENAARGIPMSSRLNYAEPETVQAGWADDNLKWNCLDPENAATFECITDPDGNTVDWVSNPASLTEIFEYYSTAAQNAAIQYIFTHYPQSYHAAYELVRIDGHIITNPGLAGALGTVVGASGVVFTPLDESGADLAIHSGDQFRVAEDAALLSSVGIIDQEEWSLAFNSDGSPADLMSRDEIFSAIDENNTVVDYDGDIDGDGEPVETGPDGLQDIAPTPDAAGYHYSPINTDLRRRVFEVTVVDCSAVRPGDDAGVSHAPIVGFAKMYLLRPPTPTCATVGLDAWETPGGERCTNDDITSAKIYTEFVGEVSTHDDTYAVLVR